MGGWGKVGRLVWCKELAKGESASVEVVRLSPLPCWSHLAPEVYRGRIQEMVREINESAISGAM